MAKVIFTNGTTKKITPKNGTNFSIDEIEEYIDGLIEIIYLGDKDNNIMIFDEEGKFKNLQLNETATRLALKTKAIHTNDYIVGNAIICNTNQLK